MTRYGWTWVDGEDDEAGKSWIQIGPLDEGGYVDGEMAVIVHRDRPDNSPLTVEQWDDLGREKERTATLICAALDAATEVAS